MVLQLALAGLGAVGSFFGASSARKAAKKTQRLQMEAYTAANNYNEAQLGKMNRSSRAAAKWLHQQKEVTTEKTAGTNTRTSSTTSSFDSDAMLAAAEKSGINPITFLRNGGMAAFVKTNTNEADTYGTTVTTTRKGHNAAQVAAMKVWTPHQIGAAPISHVPGAGEAVGGAVSQFANAAGDIVARQNAQDFTAAQAEKHQAFQRELMMMSLAGVQQANPQGGRSFFVPGFTTAGSSIKRQTQGGLSANPLASPTPEVGEVTRTNPWPAWMGMEASPYRVDAEAGETAHGDIAQELWGVYNIGEDIRWNAAKYLASSPTAQSIKNSLSGYIKDLGFSITYKPEPAKPLTFTVRPRATPPANGGKPAFK